MKKYSLLKDIKIISNPSRIEKLVNIFKNKIEKINNNTIKIKEDIELKKDDFRHRFIFSEFKKYISSIENIKNNIFKEKKKERKRKKKEEVVN